MTADIERRRTSWIRLGILALPLSGALEVFGLVFRGQLPDASKDVAAFVRVVSSPNFVAWWTSTAAGVVLAIFGFLALYAYLSPARVNRMALVAWVLAVVAISGLLSFGGFVAIAWPMVASLYARGQQAVIEMASLSASMLTVLLLDVVLAPISYVLFGVAIWKSGTLPKWSAICLAVSPFLYIFMAMISFPLEFLGEVLYMVAGVGLAYGVWRRT